MNDLEPGRGGSRRDQWRTALALEHAALCDLMDPEEEEAITADSRIQARLASCQAVFASLEVEIERSVAAVVRLDGAGVIWAEDEVSQHYIARYEYLARREIDLAGIRAEDRVLFIGSGFLPTTAFEYARQRGCAVDCVDFVPEAIACSRESAERLGLAGRVRSIQARGEAHDPSVYDVILVGVLAAPKQEILRHLDAGVKRGCRILCRTTYGLRQLIYPRAVYDGRELGRLALRDRSVACGDRVISAELLIAS
jgi:hypothetical protein